MRFKEYLNEAADFDEAKFEEDCAFYLEQVKSSNDKLMFRGIADDSNLLINQINKFVPRTKPLSSSKRFHDNVNDVLDKKFGHPFRNGLFVSGDQKVAVEYTHNGNGPTAGKIKGSGGVFVVVPVGKFDWLTNKNIEDMYSYMLHIQHEQGWAYEDAEDEVVEQAEHSTGWLHNTNLPECINSGHEMMLWCPNGYYLFKVKQFMPKALT